MSIGARLGGFLAALVVVFVAAYFIAGAVVPDSVVTRWEQDLHESTEEHGGH